MLSLFKACSKQTRPDFLAVIEIARYSFSIPVILQVALLDGNANDVRPEGCDAAAAGMPDARITNSIAAGFAPSLSKRLARRIGIWIEDCFTRNLRFLTRI